MFARRVFPSLLSTSRTMSTLSRVETANAPAALGPYAQAIKVKGFVYTSGQIAIIPATGELVEGGIVEQTKQVLTNLSEVLKASNSNLNKVVKTTVFLKDMNDFVTMNEVYSSFFSEHQPARSAVQVARLPKDVAVEIECVALTD
ncbi:endoribonuclease L-PSP [Circinella umbellata]|nr:endoribonuclease L-PSP [Circinella umbellata]